MPNFGMPLPLGLTNLHKIRIHQKLYRSHIIKF
jgi:hypothetical protein